MQSFRLGIVGMGKITQSAHLPAALASECVNLVALIDPVEERSSQIAQSYGVSPSIASSIDEVAEQLDGVIIASPNHTHAPLALQCLNSGIAVLIEKPLAISVEEGQTIVAASKQNSVVAAVGYCTRFRDNTRLIREVLRDKYFGNVRSFAYQFGSAGGWDTYSSYILDKKTAGGGVLIVTGTHFLDRVLDFFGKPTRVEYEDDSSGGPEANACAKFFYDAPDNSFSGYAFFSKTTALPPGLTIETEKGYLILPESDDGAVLFRPHDNQSIQMTVTQQSKSPCPKTADVFQRQLEDFVAACMTGSVPMVSAEFGLQSLELIDDLYSARTPMHENWYAPNPSKELKSCA